MAVRMRLQRHGKKNAPVYHIVVADGRAPRDGKFIEKLGIYNPTKNPAEISIHVDKAVQWLKNGAQPSDTVKRILSYKGVLLKKHLQGGVEKGAITQEQADVKFRQWEQEKEAKINNKKKEIELSSKNQTKQRHEAELKLKDAKAEEVAKKKAAEIAAKQNKAAEAEEEEVATTTEESVEEKTEETAE